jgi:hypothetical protein
MTDARRLVDHVRADLEEVGREIREHAYPALFEEGRAGEDDLVPFVATEWYIAQSDPRSFAKMPQRFGEDPARRDFFHAIYRSEDVAVKGFFDLAGRLGLFDARLRDWDLPAEGFGYAAFVGWSAQYASAGEVATAILVNVGAWGHNCGRLRDALEGRHGYSGEDTAYLAATFADLEPFEEETLRILQEDLDRGLEPRSTVVPILTTTVPRTRARTPRPIA